MSHANFIFRRATQLGILAVLFSALAYLLFTPVKSAQAAEVDLSSFTEILISEGIVPKENISYARMLAVETMGSEIVEPQTASVSETVASDNIFSSIFKKLKSVADRTFSSVKLSSEKSMQLAALSESQIQSILGLLKAFDADTSVLQNVESSLRGAPGTPATSNTSAPSSATIPSDENSGTAGATCTDLHQNLSFRSNDTNTDGEVSQLQRFLTLRPEARYSDGVTGFFGRRTQDAVRRFQLSEGIIRTIGEPGNGTTGPRTRARIREISCGTSRGDFSLPANEGSATSVVIAEGISTADIKAGVSFNPGSLPNPLDKLSIESGLQDVYLSLSASRVGSCAIFSNPSGFYHRELGNENASILKIVKVGKLYRTTTYTAECFKDGKFIVGDKVTVGVYIVDPSAEPRAYGDMNGDGRVTATDALLVNKYTVGEQQFTADQKVKADVNQDGKINGRDAELILQAAVGSVTLPVTEADPETPAPSASIEARLTNENSFSSSPRTVSAGTSVVLQWTSANVQSCVVASTPTGLWERNMTGSITVTPASTTTYSIECFNDGSLAVTDSVEIVVTIPPTLSLAYGDINGDGKVTASDALFVQRYAAGVGTLTDAQKERADVNQDGAIDARDAELILKAAVGSITLPFVEIPPTLAPSASIEARLTTENNFSGSARTVSAGASVVLQWTSANVQSCVVASAPTPTTLWERDMTGSVTVTPASTTTYSIECFNDGSLAVTDSVTITVTEVVRILGDINNDGRVTVSDAYRYFQALATGPALTDAEKAVGDVNEDGLYNAFDAEGIFVKSVGRDFSDITSITRTIGDMNLDNRITATDSLYVKRYVAGMLVLTPSQERAADVDMDGQITDVDADAVLARAVDIIDSLPVKFGDVTGDGNITSTDGLRALQIASGAGNPATSYEQYVADVNRDGSVTSEDSQLILKAATGSVTLPVIPASPSAQAAQNQVASVGDAVENIFTFLRTQFTL